MTTQKVYVDPMGMGKVASVCKCSKKTVLNWIYKKALKAHRTRGGHWRVWPGDLNTFIKKSGLEVPFLFTEERFKVVIALGYPVDRLETLRSAIISRCAADELIQVPNLNGTLLGIGERKPSLVLINWDAQVVDLEDVKSISQWQEERKGKLAVSVSAASQVTRIQEHFPHLSNGSLTVDSFEDIMKNIPALL